MISRMGKLSNVIPEKEITGFDEQFNVCIPIVLLYSCVYTCNSFADVYYHFAINHVAI